MERGWGAGALATLVGTAKRSILDWESDRHLPSGSVLDRLLSALGISEREHARLLALFTPAYARTRLAHDALGVPVHLGQILRAMRLRRGQTQADLARRVETSQGSIAKWESGQADPSDDAVERLLNLLLATPEERLALSATYGRAGHVGSKDLDARISQACHDVPFALRDVMLLGLESELWCRTTFDTTAEPRLCRTVGARAQIALMHGALDEVDALARRTVRLAHRAGSYEDGAAGIHTFCWLAQRRPGGASTAVRLLRRWFDLVEEKGCRDWLQAALGLAMIRAGETDEGLALLERLDRAATESDRGTQVYHRIDLFEGLLLSGQAERAYDLLAPLDDTVAPATIARTYLAIRTQPPASTLLVVRQLAGQDRLKREEAAGIERALRAVHRGRSIEMF